MKPQNFEEKVVFYYIISTYLLFFLGAQFVFAPALAWLLTFYLIKKLWQQTSDTPPEERIRIPIGVWVWIACISVIGLALVVGHLDWGFSTVKTIKSFINSFLRTWALLALFPLIGSLNIRPQIIYRAISILSLQTLILVPLTYGLSLTGLEMPLYTSTLMAKIGGNSERYYAISPYVIQSGETRLFLFAPWAPALAFACNVHFFLSSRDPDIKWRFIGMIGCAAAIVGSVSRMGIICLVGIPILVTFLVNLTEPAIQITAGIGSFIGGLFGPQLLIIARNLKDSFSSQRSNSSRVRSVLARLSHRKWEEDAPIWGHAIKVGKGPDVVAGMPIGSHHTWYGALYTHGIVGFIGILIPIVYTFIELLIKAQRSKLATTALIILLICILFSFGENLEGLAYLYWPGLVVIGMGLK